jgi:hypothetical protein
MLLSGLNELFRKNVLKKSILKRLFFQILLSPEKKKCFLGSNSYGEFFLDVIYDHAI